MRVVVLGGGYAGTFAEDRLRMRAGGCSAAPIKGGRRLERPVSAQVVTNP